MHKQSSGYNSSETSSVTRFDKAQNTVSSAAAIPVVYGLRKVVVNQTWHEANAAGNTLNKHVILCEGEIEGIVSVTANDLLIPTGTQTSNTVFTIQNRKYTDATVYLKNKTLKLYANGKTWSMYLANYDDAENRDLWEWQTSIESLISYINQLGYGWEAFPCAKTNKYPGDLWEVYSHGNYNPTVSCNYYKFYLNRGYSYYCPYTQTGNRKCPQYGNSGCPFPTASSSCYNNPVNMQASTVSGGTNYTFHNGDLPSNYENVGSYVGCAWLDMQFSISNELNGNPNVDVILKGRKIYDSRTGKTEYSTNPAMCLLDFMTNTIYGIGIPMEQIDIDSFEDCANFCDEVIEYEGADGVILSAKRYELNLVLDEQTEPDEAVSRILSCFSAFLTKQKGIYRLHIERPCPVSYSFTENTILQDSFSMSQTSIDELYGEYEISFIDPLNNWSSAKAIVEDAAAKKMFDYTLPTKTVNLEGVTSQHQVLRLGRFYRDLNTMCSTYVSFGTGAQAAHLEVGDVIRVSYYGVLGEGRLFRILEMQEESDGSFQIKAREYNESIYNDSLGARLINYNYSQINSSLTAKIPVVTNLQIKENSYVSSNGLIVSDLDITFDEPFFEYPMAYCIFYADLEDRSFYNEEDTTTEIVWKSAGITRNNYFTIRDLTWGHHYVVKVVVENYQSGVMAEGSVVSSVVKIIGKDVPPGDIKEFTLAQDKENINVVLTPPDDRDINCFELRQGYDWETGIFVKQFKDTTTTIKAPSEGTLSYMVKAIDNIGYYSENAKLATVNIVGLPTKNIIASKTWQYYESEDYYGFKLQTDGLRHKSKKIVGEYIPFSSMFGSPQENVEGAYIDFPPLDLGANVLSAAAYYINFLGKSHLLSKEVMGDYDLFAEVFGAKLSYCQPEYVIETAINADCDYKNGAIKIYYSTSLTGEGWEDWLPFSAGVQFFGRYIKIRIVPDESNINPLVVKSLRLAVDVPDIEETIYKKVSAVATTIQYQHMFLEKPTVIVFAQDLEGSQAVVKITNETSVGFDVELFDLTGSPVAGVVNIIVRGY